MKICIILWWCPQKNSTRVCWNDQDCDCLFLICCCAFLVMCVTATGKLQSDRTMRERMSETASEWVCSLCSCVCVCVCVCVGTHVSAWPHMRLFTWACKTAGKCVYDGVRVELLMRTFSLSSPVCECVCVFPCTSKCVKTVCRPCVCVYIATCVWQLQCTYVDKCAHVHVFPAGAK